MGEDIPDVKSGAEAGSPGTSKECPPGRGAELSWGVSEDKGRKGKMRNLTMNQNLHNILEAVGAQGR